MAQKLYPLGQQIPIWQGSNPPRGGGRLSIIVIIWEHATERFSDCAFEYNTGI